ncbi:hypothetical protein C4D60_Mb08t25500 [Musa balbisiana]|uniref:DYW domain-containing protein n=1 Tax=Musa balbisiana TaxID=52838 RepID=A0A4S8K6F5_MUSBA|nr:hypothetical protein C4D60_Mb08t25500 [Musa balbisiana]
MTTVSSAPVQPLLLPAPSPRAHTSSALPRNARRDHSIPSSSSLILHKTMRGEFSQSFQLFRELLASGWTPDEFALGSLLKASSTLSDCCLGEQLHAKSIRAGLASERGVRTSLVAMYSANGLLGEARHVFDEVPLAEEVDVPTWNSVISAYAFHGYYDECLLLFGAMLGAAQLTPTDATYAIVISACSASKEVRIGKAIHAMIQKYQMLDEIKMHNSLISMYAKWGHLEEAQKVFEAMAARDVVSWNAIISGLEQHGECENALAFLRRLAGLKPPPVVQPNRITFLSALSAIATISGLKLGKEVHARLIRSNLDGETSTGNSLITMYGKCGEVATGRLTFERLPSRDVISWNSMLSGYAQNSQLGSCYELFKAMQLSGSRPDFRTMTILLCAMSPGSVSSSSCRLGREIHGYLVRRAAVKSLPVSVYNGIVTMYFKCDRVGDAEKVFKGMSERDSHTWNSMIDGCLTNERCRDATMLFVEMHTQGFQPDHSTFSIILTVCSRLVSVELGKQLHASAVKQCLHASSPLTFSLSVNNALVSMYSKCGSIDDAAQVFGRMPKRDVFSWTAMITGFAHHGMAYRSLESFEAMKADGIRPNAVTFLGLLSACAHAGLVEEGTHYFNLMSKESDAEPSIEHYACLVDLFGRSGQFEKAEATIEIATSHLGLEGVSCLWLWKVLLGACHARKQLELGIRVGRRILEVDPDDETTHVLLSNIYAAFGLWKDALEVRRLMREKGLKKEAGCSWVEIGNRKHVFVAADGFHENRKEIYEKLEELDEKCRDIGYVPMTDHVRHDVDEAQKEAVLRYHSERLAVSFALLHTGKRKGGAIRVIKNLRVCEDCHRWMKFVSEVEGMEIILRDSRRFHSFRKGKCSCGDYW